MRRACAVAALCFCFSGWAHAAGKPEPSDLDLYRNSSLSGLHSHGDDDEYRRLIAAERDFGRRRSEVRAWLSARLGADAVDQVDQDVEEELGTVSWYRGPTIQEEVRDLQAAQRDLAKLERRKRRWEKNRS